MTSTMGEIIALIVNLVLGIGWALFALGFIPFGILVIVYFAKDDQNFKKKLKPWLLAYLIMPVVLFLVSLIRSLISL